MSDRLPAEDNPIVAADIYPAKVTVPYDAIDPDRDELARIGYRDGDSLTLRACRVVVTRERLYVWATPMGFPSVVYEREWFDECDVQARPAARCAVGVRNDDGSFGPIVVIEPDPAAGCGCGSPLKSLSPFVPYRTGPLDPP